MPRRTAATLVSLALASPLLLLGSPAHAAPVSPVAKPYDFNGDGFPELVVGAPGLQVGSVKGAGGITVLPASRKGVSSKGRVLTQDTAGVAGAPQAGHAFGSAFASADFDRDGFADLAVGSPVDEYDDDDNPGAVTVLRGSATGLTGSGSYVLTRPTSDGHDSFGDALAAADFDGDGYADLAVGALAADPEEVQQDDYYANGSVTVFRGGSGTFSTNRSTVLHGDRTGEDYDVNFGASLAVGDVDGDARPDLVVGTRGMEYDDGEGIPGSVTVCPSGDAGPGGCVQVSLSGDYAGSTTLAVGNVRGDARPEIVVGSPNDEPELEPAGTVYTLALTGTGTGLGAQQTSLEQSTKGVPGTDEGGDEFGASVALGDLDHDGYADLVVGSSREAIGKRDAAGRVTVVYGGKDGYRTSGNKAYDQNTKGVPSTAEDGDAFGSAVSLLDHDADGHLDLTVGSPGENRTGAVTTLDGSGKGFTTKGSKTFGLGTVGYPTPRSAAFGAVLAR